MSGSHDDLLDTVTHIINLGLEGLTVARSNITFRIVTPVVQQTSTDVSKQPAASIFRSEQKVPPKFSYPSIGIHGVMSQKTVIF